MLNCCSSPTLKNYDLFDLHPYIPSSTKNFLEKLFKLTCLTFASPQPCIKRFGAFLHLLLATELLYPKHCFYFFSVDGYYSLIFLRYFLAHSNNWKSLSPCQRDIIFSVSLFQKVSSIMNSTSVFPNPSLMYFFHTQLHFQDSQTP